MSGNQISPQTLKGFRDFLPNQAIKRQYVISLLKSVFELYGFDPLESFTWKIWKRRR
jgi:histidyl-tRNA synthetase